MKRLLFVSALLFLNVALYAQAGSSPINVRLYAGVNPFRNTQWNNWNVGTAAFQTPVSSGLFNYANGSPSTVYATLNTQAALSDNGVGYARNASMCPDTVLRFTSYITSGRTLTLKGLDNTGKYNIEFYASRGRTDGQITKFAIGSQAINVSTDNNASDVAAFSSVSPSNGSITVTISRVVTYNYLNGFKITKVGGAPVNNPPVVNAGANKTITLPANSVTLTGTAMPGSSPIVSSMWRQVSGPGTAVIQSSSDLSTVINNLVPGIYVFRLFAFDGNSLTGTSTVSVTVNANGNTKKRIVLLGSSTAAGYFENLWPVDSGYAKQLTRYYKQAGMLDSLYVLAANGANPYQAMPTWYAPNNSLQPPNVYTYDVNRNITRALTLHPDVILCHFPTNNFDVLSMAQVMFAFRTIKATADSAGIPIFFIGTQPRGNWSVINKQKLVTINDSLKAAFGPRMISYYDSVATAPRSLYMKPALVLSSDSIHMKPAGHDIIFRQIIHANIFSVASDVYAGPNQTIRLPLNSVTLRGNIIPGNNPISSIVWSQSGGPNTALIQTPASLSTLVSKLVLGTYTFKLTGINSQNTVFSSTVQVTYDSAILTVSSGSSINVRLYGGTAPFMNRQWNNWNVGTSAIQTGATSKLFNNADGTPSSVYAVLNIQGGLYDNGINYTQNASICPDTALRFVSYITSARTLTIKGLDNASKYYIELYSSRSGTSGQVTRFAIGTHAIDVSTDNNTSDVAAFSSISPSNGSIVVTISRVVVYNYLNGFKISRISGTGTTASNNIAQAAEKNEITENLADIRTYPNPATNNLTIINRENDLLRAEIFDLTGRRLMLDRESDYSHQINMSRLKPGSYILLVTHEKTGQTNRKIIVKL